MRVLKNIITLVVLLTCQVALLGQNFSLISWNLKKLGESKDESELKIIAKTISKFDIVALQEVVAVNPAGAQKVAELADMLNRMGAKWDYRISDPTSSPGRNRKERYAFLWKTKKAMMLSRPWLDKTCEPTMYREPYLARFKINGEIVLIANYHSRSYRESPEEEIPCFYQFQSRYPDDQIVIVGDWNAKSRHEVFEPLYAQGYASNLNGAKTTLKQKCSISGQYRNHAIDFILFETDELCKIDSGVVDFVGDCERLSEMRGVSDHLPVWVELGL